MSLSDLRRIFPSQIRPPRRSARLRRPSSSSRSAQPVAAAVRSLIHPVVPSPSQPRFIDPGRRSSDVGLDPSSSFSVLRPPATPSVAAISLIRVSRGRPPPSVAAPADGIGAAEICSPSNSFKSQPAASSLSSCRPPSQRMSPVACPPPSAAARYYLQQPQMLYLPVSSFCRGTWLPDVGLRTNVLLLVEFVNRLWQSAAAITYLFACCCFV